MTTTHFFELRDRHNARIACRIDRPETESRPGLAAILCHGMFSSMEGDKNRLYTRMLADMGIPTLRFDFPGRGESEGTDADITVGRQLDALRAVVTHARQAIGFTRFILMGSSFGSITALLALVDSPLGARMLGDDETAALLLVAHPHRSDFTAGMAGGANLNTWRIIGELDYEGHKLSYALHDELDSLPPMEELMARVTVPVLVAHGEKDDLFPHGAVARLFDALGSSDKELLIEPEADHRFGRDLWRIHLLDRTRAFLERVL